MPLKFFKCPDDVQIEILKCLAPRGCRLHNRCASIRTLNLVGQDRKWRLSPSCAGNGPRYEYLRATVDYAIKPQSKTFAILGTGSHSALHRFDDNVLSEEPLSDGIMSGTPDALEADEEKPGFFVLIDDKTWGSYKVAKALGVVKEEETVLDENQKPVIFKSGKRKGQPKTKQVSHIDPTKIDMRDTELQINRYRIMFEANGVPISKMFIEAIVRDGNTAHARSRMIKENIYMIPVKRLPNDEVLDYYRNLNDEIMGAFKTHYARKCDMWESWNRRRCEEFCDVAEQCQNMSRKAEEKWVNII